MEKKHCNGCGQPKPVDEFSAKRLASDGLQARCKACMVVYHREYYHKHKDVLRPRIAESTRQRRKSIRAWIAGIKSCGCQLCPEDDTCCLDFHHLDSDEKELNIAQGVDTHSVAVLLTEINKCVVLCRNCHSKVHAGRKSCEGLSPLTVANIPEGMIPRAKSKTRSATIKASGRAKDGLRHYA